MFDRIEQGLYWDRLWRLIDGCTPCSPGCGDMKKHGGCWAAREAKVRIYGAKDLLGPDGMWNENIRLRHDNLDLPLHTKKPQAWLILNDLFHEKVQTDFIKSAWEVMGQCPQHIFLVLTKRAKRLPEIAHWLYRQPSLPLRITPFKNIWPGVTVCNQEEADEKIPILLQIPAAVKWVSIEPMLGPINITDQPWWDWRYTYNFYPKEFTRKPLDWVVLGGESGPRARPMKPEWVRSVRDQCQVAGVPFFFKKHGSWNERYYGASRFDPTNTGRLLDGRTWDELPTKK